MERCIDCRSLPCICNQPEDLFGSPFYCQKRKRTRKFTSPNSPLDQKELDELQACIEAANDLLRSLGSQSNDQNTRQLQLHFLEMRGENIEANINCEKAEIVDESSNISKSDNIMIKTICLCGKIATAGRDFLQVNQTGSAVFIPYNNLLSIKKDEKKEEMEIKPEFIDAQKELRRKLAFNFGEFVSKNPTFINLFFGLPLYLMLKQFKGKDFNILTNEGIFTGTLIRVDEGKIKLLNRKEELDFDLEEVCYLKALNLK